MIVRMTPVKQLSPINLTDRGTVTKIHGRAFVAGALPIKVSVIVLGGDAYVKIDIKNQHCSILFLLVVLASLLEILSLQSHVGFFSPLNSMRIFSVNMILYWAVNYMVKEGQLAYLM